MFKKREDGEYSFSGRFWIQAIILLLLICAIGVSTQRTANETNDLSAATIAYAKQTNDCLAQVITTLKTRISYNADVDDLNARDRAARDELFQEALSTNLADPVAKQSILNEYFTTINKIAVERQRKLDARDNTEYPNPNCGNKLPGE